ncbi:hypothetical protein [Sagittula sp. SSi028]
MIKTIKIGQHISVQGLFEKLLPDGRMQVSVGSTIYAGMPVSAPATPAS